MRSWPGAVLRAAIGAVLVAIVLYALGADHAHLALAALVLGASVLVVQVLIPTPRHDWPDAPDPPDRPGWHQLQLTMRSLEELDSDPEAMGRVLVPRLRTLLSAELERRGISATSAQARDLVGADLYDRLATSDAPARSGGRQRGPASQLTAEVLDRLDSIRTATEGR